MVLSPIEECDAYDRERVDKDNSNRKTYMTWF